MTKWKHVLRNIYKLITNEKLKCLVSKSIQTPESICCRNPFTSDYSLEYSWVCLHQLCTSGFGNCLPFLLEDLLKLCQVGWGVGEPQSQWDSFHRFSMGFKSGLWLGRSRTFMFLFWSHSSVALPVCLGSLSCWNINLHRCRRSFALWSRFSSRIGLYLAPFIVPSVLTSLPVPTIEKHPHSMMLTPTCFRIRC